MATASPRLKTIVLPPEHGAWGFLLEPLFLGLLVAPSAAGAWLALGVIGLFMARHPAKIALVDWQRGRRYTRTRLAERIAGIFGLVGVLGFALAALISGEVAFLLPFVLGVPLGAVVLAGYAQNRARDLLPELAGATALALAVFSLALAGGESMGVGAALTIIMIARNVASILYVRARLRLDKDRPYSPIPSTAAHIAGSLAAVVLAVLNLAPWLAVAALAILLARAVFGLSPYRQRVRVQTIGFLEIGYGLLTVLLTALGYALGV